MKRTLILFAGIILSAVISSVNATSIYVSPKGNDAQSGAESSPVASVQRAFALAQQAMGGNDTVFIYMADGTYPLSETFLITENARPVVFAAQGQAKPCISGGFNVSGWQPWERGIWRTRVPEVSRYGISFEQFYVNGRRAVPARSPNVGYYYLKEVTESVHCAGKTERGLFAVQKLTVDPMEILPIKGLQSEERDQVMLTMYHKWNVTRKRIDYLNADSSHVYVSGSAMQPWNKIEKGTRYVLSNYLEALDQEGEWYLSLDGWMYYKPLPGEDLSKAECVAPTMEKLMIFRGEPNRPVKNIGFRNITFAYSAYVMPSYGDDAQQAAASTLAAIEGDYAEGIFFDNCRIEHTGAYGLWMRRECFDVNIDHCSLTDLGAGGIKIGDLSIRNDNRPVTARVKVNNSIIQHAGYVFPCGVGISIFQASDNQITHNEISDIRYSGISVGWKWGYNSESGLYDSPAVRNIIEYNHVHHIGWAELSDMGAVYTLGVSPGTRVCHNVIHDIYSYDYGGWGLYTDEGSSGIVMSNNLVYRCKSGSFHQHYGRENVIENNIFAFGYRQSLYNSVVEKHISFFFRHNIILQDQGETMTGHWDKGLIEYGANCYWDLRKEPITFKGMTAREWMKQKEPHSIVANPCFKNAKGGDFTFTSTKAIRKIGFKPFDYSKAGVYGSTEWIKQAELSRAIVDRFEEVVQQRERESVR